MTPYLERGRPVVPVRLQLSRRKGFDLQALSRATNGLRAVNVARPSRWGNPFIVHHPNGPMPLRKPMSPQAAVSTFRSMLEKGGGWFPVPLPWPKGMIPKEYTTVDDAVRELRGHNLACWCALDRPCHADVLLELAARPVCLPVESGERVVKPFRGLRKPLPDADRG